MGNLTGRILDLSHWPFDEGKVDLVEAKKAGIVACIMKLTDGGGFVDDKADVFVAEALRAEMPFGWFHFYNPWGPDAPTQYEYFTEEAAKRPPAQLYPSLDFEWGDGYFSKYSLSNMAYEFLRLGAPKEQLLYSNLNYLNNVLVYFNSQIRELSDIWLAWPTTGTYCPKPKLWSMDAVKLHQDTWTLTVPGIDDPTLDGNRVLDLLWLKKQIGGTTPPYIVNVQVPQGIDKLQIDVEFT